MALSFNIPTSPAATYTTTIERKAYIFSFKWQTRNKSWYLDITTREGDILAKAVKLVPNVPLIRKNLNKGPDGNIYIVANTDVTTDIPARSNIGPNKDFELLYISNAELANVS